jgi:hypothetical protein
VGRDPRKRGSRPRPRSPGGGRPTRESASPLVHARHDERAVRDQTVSPLVAKAPEHRRLGHRNDLDPIAGMA